MKQAQAEVSRGTWWNRTLQVLGVGTYICPSRMLRVPSMNSFSFKPIFQFIMEIVVREDSCIEIH